ncbi:MAG: efflux RND transporter permease subunit, partial [Rickettsiales bacterium]|nr:efflux RND transporter permease subunit [Rickettsiales bacterium]
MPDTNLPHDPTQSVIARVIEWSVRNPLLISILALAILAGGIRAIQHMPLDAIPDLSDTQVIIRTDFDGQAPKIVEDLVTYPLSSAMLGVPRAKVVRGYSMYGDSFIYIIFKDGTDLYWARARVLEALSRVQSILPEGAKVQLGPDATGVGWVYQYALVDKSGKHDLAELRAIQDWFLKYELATVPGVAEVASVGGFVKEYQ